jgi:hypothetical protein
MPDRVNDDFVAADFVEYQIRIRQCGQASDAWIVGGNADMWMRRKQIDDELKALMYAPSSFRRVLHQIIENGAEVI